MHVTMCLLLPCNNGFFARFILLKHNILDGSNVKILPTNIKYLSNLATLSLNNCKMFLSLPELPEHIKEFCTTSKHKNGDEKYISFNNGKMLESNDLSLNCITEDTILVMKSVALYNVLVHKRCSETHSYNYDSVVVYLPGSRIPSKLKYKTSDSKLTIGFSDIYYSLGFIFAVVVSPSNGMKNERGSGAKIQCKCYREDGSQVGVSSEWHSEPVTNLDMFLYGMTHTVSVSYNTSMKEMFLLNSMLQLIVRNMIVFSV
ncbi:hypothetical protein MTR_8g018250 [Medicago truncatula]|uniref:Uncharacterized protein n=1 Tax=Medicago truncatula TaxID=3880 RepID=G7LI79_MEDTR|nr:hypothetical protein MTR_8g018250 [Medicago truncatula]